MRIGLVVPRINGIALSGLGIPPGPTPESVINDIVQGWSIHPSIPCPAPSPDQIRANLMGEAQSTCITWPAQCPNGIPSAAIEQAVAIYADMIHWNGSKAALCPDDAVNGYAPSQQPGYVPPVVAPPQQSGTPNALNTAAPQPTVVNQTPQGNVLSPPQQSQPVSGQNSGSFTGTDTTANKPGSFLTDNIDIGSLSIPTWALLAAAGVGLYMMGKK